MYCTFESQTGASHLMQPIRSQKMSTNSKNEHLGFGSPKYTSLLVLKACVQSVGCTQGLTYVCMGAGDRTRSCFWVQTDPLCRNTLAHAAPSLLPIHNLPLQVSSVPGAPQTLAPSYMDQDPRSWLCAHLQGSVGVLCTCIYFQAKHITPSFQCQSFPIMKEQ